MNISHPSIYTKIGECYINLSIQRTKKVKILFMDKIVIFWHSPSQNQLVDLVDLPLEYV